MKAIFLSASVPDPSRDPKYYRMGDVARIRDAVDALVGVVLPRGILVWGGHSAISPFVRRVAERVGRPAHVKTWQSEEYRGQEAADTRALPDIIWTPRGRDRHESLAIMRREMLTTYPVVMGVFIGGMEGVEDEHALFLKECPHSITLAMASTGGAARILWKQHPHIDPVIQDRLHNDLVYDLLFEDLVIPLLQ